MRKSVNHSRSKVLAVLGLAGAVFLAPLNPAIADEDYFNVDGPEDIQARPVTSKIARKAAPPPVEETDVDEAGSAKPRVQDTAKTYDQSAPASSLTLKAGASYCVPKGTPMSLKVTSATPKMGMKLLEKDLEGNPIPARVNDVITAMITEDIYVDGDRVIPEGTVFRGHVVHINGPRRVQRPGWVDIKFNELELPNHRIFRFAAQADNLEASTKKTKLKAAGMIASNMAGGAIVGAIVAYQLSGGMQNTIAMHGYNVAGGAAAGAILAGGHAIMKRGHAAWLEPGDGLNLSIDTDMVMPALQAPTKKVVENNNLAGVKIDVLKCKLLKDGIGGHYYRMDMNITNDSEQTLKAIDLYLVDSNGTKNPISMGPEGDEGSTFQFKLQPSDFLRTRVYFAAEHPKLPHSFVWYDHYNPKKVCFRQKLEI